MTLDSRRARRVEKPLAGAREAHMGERGPRDGPFRPQLRAV